MLYIRIMLNSFDAVLVVFFPNHSLKLCSEREAKIDHVASYLCQSREFLW